VQDGRKEGQMHEVQPTISLVSDQGEKYVVETSAQKTDNQTTPTYFSHTMFQNIMSSYRLLGSFLNNSIISSALQKFAFENVS
jgi:hypothetical protein